MKRMWSLKQIKEFIKDTTKDISTLVDKDGNPRFIEGDVELGNVPEGVTKTYGKWSLSGSHLLIVLILAVPDTTALTGGFVFGTLKDFPEWLENKIVPLFGNYIDVKTFNLWGSDGSYQSHTANLYKSDGTTTVIANGASTTATKDRALRLAYDILIDNE